MKKYLTFILIACAFVIAGSAKAQSYTFSTDLGIGSRGSDVSNLQTMLVSQGYSIPSISSGIAQKGYFGQETAAALSRYQSANGISPTGFFGPATRVRFGGGTYNGGNNGNNGGIIYPNIPGNVAPVISGIDAPTVLTVNQAGTWTVRASDPYNGNLTYSVDWGDVTYYPNSYAAAAPSAQFFQTGTFTHSYANTGTYSAQFSVRNQAGLTAKSSVTVQVTGNYNGGGSYGTGPLKIVSPNGNEVLVRGNTFNILWTSPAYFRATYADLRLVPYQTPCVNQICPLYMLAPYTIVSGISANANSYSWRVGSVQSGGSYSTLTTIPDGRYTMQICETGTSNCDSSDSTFTISASGNSSTLPDINIVSPNGGSTWQSGVSQNVSVLVSGNSAIVGNRIDFVLANSSNQETALYTLSQNLSAGTTNVNVPVPSTITPGSYRLLVRLYNSYGQQIAYDYSDSYFNVVSSYGGYSCPTGYVCPTQNPPVYTSPLYGCPTGYTCTQNPTYPITY